VTTPQVCIVLGARWVLTFQQLRMGFFDPVRARIRDRTAPIRRLGADFLAYALVDAVVDHYYPVVEELTVALDDIEDEVMRRPSPELLARLHAIRRQLVVLRRIGWPQREAVIALRRDPSPFVTDEVRTFLRDTESHIAQIVELVDSSREMAASLMDIYLSTVSQRTNDVMKVLTILSSIFIPITFVAGVYGMNFEAMPELHASWGYPVALAAMAVIAVAMIVYFRRRGWIGRDDEDG
jgi:magnesium transporter